MILFDGLACSLEAVRFSVEEEAGSVVGWTERKGEVGNSRLLIDRSDQALASMVPGTLLEDVLLAGRPLVLEEVHLAGTVLVDTVPVPAPVLPADIAPQPDTSL